MQADHDDWANFTFQTTNVTNNDDDFGEFGSASFVGGNEPNQNTFESNDWSGFDSGASVSQIQSSNLQQQPPTTQLTVLDDFAIESIPTATALPVEDSISSTVTVPAINLDSLPNLTELQLSTGLNSLQIAENNDHNNTTPTAPLSPKQSIETPTAESLMNEFILLPKSPISSYPTSPQLSPRASTNNIPKTHSDDAFSSSVPSVATPSLFASSEFPVNSNSPDTSREEIEFTFDTNTNNNNLDSNMNDSGSILLNETATTQDMLISDSLNTSTQSSPSEMHVPLTTEPEQPSDVKSLVVQQISLLKENDKTLNVSVEVNMEEANPLISVSEKERESAEEEQRKQTPAVPDQPEMEYDWKAPTFSPGEISLVSMRGRSKTNLRDSLEKKPPVELSPSEDTDVTGQVSPSLSPRKEDKHFSLEEDTIRSDSYPSPLLSPVKKIEPDLDSVVFDDDASATNEEWGNFEQPELKQSQDDLFGGQPKQDEHEFPKDHDEDIFSSKPQEDEDIFPSKPQADEDIFPKQQDEDLFSASKAQQEDEDIFPATSAQPVTTDDFDDFGGFETANTNNNEDDFGTFADSGSTFDAEFEIPSVPTPIVSQPAPVSDPPVISQASSETKSTFFAKSADEIRSTVDQTLISLNAGQLRITNDAPKDVKLLQNFIAENAASNHLPFITKLEQAAKMELTPKRYLQSLGEGGESRRYLSPMTLPAMYASFIESLDIKIIPPEEEVVDVESGLLKPQPASISAVNTGGGTPPLSPLLNRAAAHRNEPKAPADVFTAFGELGIQFDGNKQKQPSSNQNSAPSSPVVTPRAQSTPSSPSSTPRNLIPSKTQSAPVVELSDFSSFEAFSAPVTTSVAIATPAPEITMTASPPVATEKPDQQHTFASEASSWNSASATNTFEVSDFGFSEFTAASAKPAPVQPQPTSETFEADWGSYAGPVASTISAVPTQTSPVPSPREVAPDQNSQDEFSSFTATTTQTDDFGSWADFNPAPSTTVNSPDLSSFTSAQTTTTTAEPFSLRNSLPMTTQPTEFEVMNPQLLPATQHSPAVHSVPQVPTATSLGSQFTDFTTVGTTHFGSDNTFSTDFTSSSFSVGTDFGATGALASTASATSDFGSFETAPAFGSSTATAVSSSFGGGMDFGSFETTAAPASATPSATLSTTSDFGSFDATPAFGSSTATAVPASLSVDMNFGELASSVAPANGITTSDFSSFEIAKATPAFAADFSSFGTSPPSSVSDFRASLENTPAATMNTDFTSLGAPSLTPHSDLGGSLGTSPVTNTDFSSFANPSPAFVDFGGFGSSTGQASPNSFEQSNTAFSSSFGSGLAMNTSSTSSDLFRDIGSGLPQTSQTSPTVTVVAAPEFDDDFGSFVDSSQHTFDFDHPATTSSSQPASKAVSDEDFFSTNSTPSIPTLVAIPTTAPMPTGPSAVLAVSSGPTSIVGSPRSSVDVPPLALSRLGSPSQTPKVLSPIQTPKVMSPSHTPKTLSPRSSVDFHPTASFSSLPMEASLNFAASFSSTDSFSRSIPQSPRSSVDINPAMSRSMPSFDINPIKPSSPTSSMDFTSFSSAMKPMSNPVSPRTSVDVHPIGFINPAMSKSMDTNLSGKPMSPRSSVDVMPLGMMNPNADLNRVTPRGMSPRSSVDLAPGNINHAFMNPIQQLEIPTAVPLSSMPTASSSLPSLIPTTTSMPSVTPLHTASIPTATPVTIPTATAAPVSSAFDDFADFQDASSSFQFEADFDATPTPAKPINTAPTLTPSPTTSTSPPASSMMFPQSTMYPSTTLMPMAIPQQPQSPQKSNASLLRSSMDILSQQNLARGAIPMQASLQPTGVSSYMGSYNPQPQIQAIRPNMTGGSYNATQSVMPGYVLPTQPAVPLQTQSLQPTQPVQTPIQPVMPLQSQLGISQPAPVVSDYAKSAIPPEHDRAYLGWIGSLSRPESESRLAMVGDGTYLVRWAESHSTYVISCKLSGMVQHLNVLRNVDGRVAVSTTNELFPNIKECVQSFRSRGFISKPIAI